MKTSVLIVGGGIAGLSAALTLADAGLASCVFEQAEEFSEVGAGIQLSPNCTRILDRLGLDPALRQTAVLPNQAEIRDWKSGKLLSKNTFVPGSQAKFPYYHIHRADLMAVLVQAARSNPLIQLENNACIDEISQSATGVQVTVNNQIMTGDVLLGADGIHSRVRQHLFGHLPARFTGNVAWRALVRTDKLPVRPPKIAGVWWGPGKHFVHYYVRGGEWVNCVCVVEKSGWQIESWSEQGDREELKQDFSGWHESIQMLIDFMEVGQCYKWALFDRPPMKHWSRGRITLLGDACHATLPFMAQGAALAIEDAAVLALCLKSCLANKARGDVSVALLRYESLRLARTAKIQRGSRRNAAIFHLQGVKAWIRNKALLANPAQRVMQNIYQHNVYSDFSG